MGIVDKVRERIGAKNTKTEIRDAEAAVDKIRSVIAAPAKRLADAEQNVANREAQLAAAEADAAARALAGEQVNDYTALETALAHDRNTVKAYSKALEQIRAEQQPALDAALAELAGVRKEDRRAHFERAARRFREAWVIGLKCHAEMVEAYVPGEHPQLSVLSFSDERQIQPWDEVANRFLSPPVKVVASDHPDQVVRFEGEDVPMWGKYSSGDVAFLAPEDAFRAVVSGAAVYHYDDDPQTRELTKKAAAERQRLHRHPNVSEDFPQQT